MPFKAPPSTVNFRAKPTTCYARGKKINHTGGTKRGLLLVYT